MTARAKINDAEMFSRYSKGETMESLAHAYNVSVTTVFRHINDTGQRRSWKKKESAKTRFNRKIIIQQNGCWKWTGYLNKRGYGLFSLNHKRIPAHRFSYIMKHGEIPENLQLDHLCSNPPCVNPEHLEPVTGKINKSRSPITIGTINSAKTCCPRGHDYTRDNTYVSAKNQRTCRKCHAIHERNRRFKRGMETKTSL